MKRTPPLILKALTVVLLLAFIGMMPACSDDQPTEQNNDPEYRGNVISSTLVTSYTVVQVDSILNSLGLTLSAANGIEFYKVVYETIDGDGQATIASGALLIPQGVTNAPVASYQHGTSVLKTDVPSSNNYEAVIGIILSGTGGYLMMMPDYLGMGDGPGLHPYQHGKTEATASVDMLRAGLSAASDLGTESNGQLFLFGYSQGGHSTMALHKELEQYHADEFSVTASAPMSGAYHLSGPQADMILLDDPYASPFYLPYLLLAYNEQYDLYASTSDYMKEPWASTLPPMFDGLNSSAVINAAMPDVPKLILKDDVLQSFIDDADDAFRASLEDNDLIDWTPQAPVRLYYCTGDDQVNYQNSLDAYDAFSSRGADVSLVNSEILSGGSPLDHGGCVEPTLLLAQIWFDSLVEE